MTSTDSGALFEQGRAVATLSVPGREPWVHGFTEVLRFEDGRWRIAQVPAFALPEEA